MQNSSLNLETSSTCCQLLPIDEVTTEKQSNRRLRTKPTNCLSANATNTLGQRNLHCIQNNLMEKPSLYHRLNSDNADRWGLDADTIRV